MEPEKIQFSHYRALKLIGKGGVGEVYLADDTREKRQVATKIISIEVLKAGREANVNTLRLFLREVAASARLNHPNILPIGDHGEVTLDKVPIAYVIMPYRPEGSLSAWLSQHAQKQANWRPTLLQVIHIIRQTGAALQHAHDHKIMHLDVKPTNLLLHNRSAVDDYPDLLLSDFGSSSLANAAQIRGTSAYTAPEQRDNQPVFASDQYALAALAYELLTGSLPFQEARPNGPDVAVQERLKPVSAFVPQLPSDVDLVLQRALAKKPEERFPVVAAFAQAFQAALQSVAAKGEIRPPANTPPPAPQSPTKPESNGDIRTILRVSTQEARDGAVRMLNLPNGQKIEVQIPAGAREEQVITLNGKGETPAPGVPAGNLYLRLSLPKISAIMPPTRNNTAAPNPAPAKFPTPAPGVPSTPTPPTPPQPNMAQGPAAITPLPLFPLATPQPNALQGPASIAPPAPMPPRPNNMPQGPASVAPLAPSPITPRPNMAQRTAGVAPLSSSRDAFVRQKPDMSPSAPATPQLKRANSPFAVIVMVTLLLIALGVGSYGALTSNWALLQNILYGTPAPTVPNTYNPVTPTAPGKTTSSVWHTQTSGTSQELVAVTWADTRFATVGSNGTILTSPNGSTWTAEHSGTSQFLWNVTWSGSLLVAVGTAGTILTSPDGITWTVQHSGTTQDLWDVDWVDGSLFVAVGTDGTILTSKDGHTWATQQSTSGQILDGIGWSGSVLAVVGTNGLIITSTDDGTTWAIQNSGIQQLLQSIAWVNNQFVAVGTNGTILTSAKGTTWTIQNSSVTQNLSGVSGTGSQFVIVGDNGTILTSAKGTAWAVQPSGTVQHLSGIALSTTTFAATSTTPIPTTPIFVAVGNHGTILIGP